MWENVICEISWKKKKQLAAPNVYKYVCATITPQKNVRKEDLESTTYWGNGKHSFRVPADARNITEKAILEWTDFGEGGSGGRGFCQQ